MHPNIQQSKPGKCPECGMKLVLQDQGESNSYMPLFVLIGLIVVTSLVISYRIGFSVSQFVTTFMIGFFLVFSGFKFMDLSGFAEGYATYDLLAQRVYAYGYIYPFIELFFALAMIVNFQTKQILVLECIVMLFSGIGVALKLARHEKFHCACLGTFLKVPLTNITLIEDFGMAALALILLLSK